MIKGVPSSDKRSVPFTVIPSRGRSRVVLVCDHASDHIPPAWNNLGVDAGARRSHIAWDIGAAEVTRRLAHRLGCTAVLAGASRLVIDCNRRPGEASSIPVETGGVEIPGNRNLTAAQVAARVDDWFWPYHRAIGASLAHIWRGGLVPAVIAIHSFTPRLQGAVRPWHVGVLWNRDDRLALPALGLLRARPDLTVGDNQPYSARDLNYTLDTHAASAGIPHVSFEIRQDLVDTAAGIAFWTDLLASLLQRTLTAAPEGAPLSSPTKIPDAADDVVLEPPRVANYGSVPRKPL